MPHRVIDVLGWAIDLDAMAPIQYALPPVTIADDYVPPTQGARPMHIDRHYESEHLILDLRIASKDGTGHSFLTNQKDAVNFAGRAVLHDLQDRLDRLEREVRTAKGMAGMAGMAGADAAGVTGCAECDSGNTPHTPAHEGKP